MSDLPERSLFGDSVDLDVLDLPGVPLLFGRFLVLGGHLSESQIFEALKVQRDLGAMSVFALIEQGLLTVEEVGRLRDYQRRELVGLEEAMSRLGLPVGADREMVLALLKSQHLPLGEILVGQGHIGREELESLLEGHQRHQRDRWEP